MPVLLLLISNVAAIALSLAIARRLAPNAGFARGVAALLTSYVAVVCATLALLGMACRLDPWWVTAAVSVATAALLILARAHASVDRRERTARDQRRARGAPAPRGRWR